MVLLVSHGWLPLNPYGNGPQTPDQAFNTCISFMVNCNLQHYSGESGLTYFTQLFVIMLFQFVTAACGMAAAAAVDLLKGSTRQIGNAFALALKNILGLVCDPVGGLVEVPCVKRNLLAVEMAMNGIESVIPPDEVIEAMGDVGRRLPVELKETSRAGLAVTKTGRRINEEILKKSAMVK